jgi:hypothetical protein
MAIAHLRTLLPPHFIDPVTGCPPTNEREFSALLAFFHQRASIAWDRVTLYEPGSDAPVTTADSLFRPGGVLMTDPLCQR